MISQILKENFEKASEKEADFVVFQTCGVVQKTERKIIKRALKAKQKGKKIIFTGCLPLISPLLCKKVADGAIGPTNILDLKKVIKFVLAGKKYFALKQKPIDKAKLGCLLVQKETCTATIPISEGCISNCSFCATKLAKGRLRSFDQRAIIENVKLALSQGAKEIQLTSQDLAIYGAEKGKWELPELLSEILKIKGNFRIRLGMMNPFGAKKIFEKLLKIMESKKIYKFLHIPLQSGDDKVLMAMNRPYKVKEFLELYKKFKQKFKNSVFATDVIVGFPTEDERAFQNTLNVIKKIKPEILHLFRYSRREGTEAAKLRDFPDRIKKERSRILTRVWFEILKEKNKKYLGKNFEALITEKRGESFLARLNSYKAVILKEGKVGDFVKVRILSSKPNYLVGKICQG